MESIIKNYTVLRELWDQAADVVRDTETIARIRGVESQMQLFHFFFGLVLGEILLRHADNLSKTLQKNCSASEGQRVAAMTKKTLQQIRSEESFDLFWEKVNTMARNVDVSEPALPRRRKMPKRFEDGTAAAEFPSSPKILYRQVYYEALDLLQSIEDRFDQPGYQIYCCLEKLLENVAKGKSYSQELDQVLDVYGTDLNASNLRAQLEILSSNLPDDVVDLAGVQEHLQGMSRAEKSLLSEVILVMKLILVMPATNASSERSFSALRRVKSYLRSTMTQERLNHLMVLLVHKERTDHLALRDVANDFVSKSERRKQVFGNF